MKPTTMISRPTAARQVASFIAKFDPSIAKLVRAARLKLRQRIPGAVELVYDNYNALVIGFGPTERASDAIVSLAVYPRWVNLYFIQGARLPDPEKLLKGSGNQGRYITLHSADDVLSPAVAALMDAAIRHSRVPFDLARRGHTVVKSVSARQRPRRVQFQRRGIASVRRAAGRAAANATPVRRGMEHAGRGRVSGGDSGPAG